MIASLLWQRGFRDPEEARTFLRAGVDRIGDPFAFHDMERACERIRTAIRNRERILIHGDYDVDGVTSAALFSRFLEKVGADVHTHVPHRMKEGYGIHLRAVEAAREMGAKVFLTCDCGISAHEQVDAAREAGMTVVVTDHHTVPPDLPEAAALINPHRSDSSYPFRELSGAGVVFRFCEGLAKELDLPISAYRRAYLDLAVLGTVADVMPLVGENRIITK
ncbi:MAG: DHH family phosphoesterase, partial [Planctomycetes bacterium]|nr:DHH family phosphoesterase [Planctomycetota bacterium]